MPYADLSNQPPNIKTFDEAWTLVYNNLFDPTIKNGKWQDLGARYKILALNARNQKEMYRIIQDMLNELKVSHLRIMEAEVFDYDIDSETRDINYPCFGLDMEKYSDGFFVREVVEGGAAKEAGLQRGDKVIAVDGIKAEYSPLIRMSGTGGVYRIYPRAPLSLIIQRSGKLIRVNMAPKSWNRISASEDSKKIFYKNGLSLCYIHLWHLANYKMVVMLKDFLHKNKCNGLLLDLRGFGGTVSFLDDFLNILRAWGKPVVAIIDKETRSIKETIAVRLRDEKLATLVGEKTVGSCLASQFFSLSDGGSMIIPIIDMKDINNRKNIEGNGVRPDYNVSIDVRKLNGQDPHLVKAIQVLAKRLS